jgi:hypothetical protein
MWWVALAGVTWVVGWSGVAEITVVFVLAAVSVLIGLSFSRGISSHAASTGIRPDVNGSGASSCRVHCSRRGSSPWTIRTDRRTMSV